MSSRPLEQTTIARTKKQPNVKPKVNIYFLAGRDLMACKEGPKNLDKLKRMATFNQDLFVPNLTFIELCGTKQFYLANNPLYQQCLPTAHYYPKNPNNDTWGYKQNPSIYIPEADIRRDLPKIDDKSPSLWDDEKYVFKSPFSSAEHGVKVESLPLREPLPFPSCYVQQAIRPENMFEYKCYMIPAEDGNGGEVLHCMIADKVMDCAQWAGGRCTEGDGGRGHMIHNVENAVKCPLLMTGNDPDKEYNEFRTILTPEGAAIANHDRWDPIKGTMKKSDVHIPKIQYYHAKYRYRQYYAAYDAVVTFAKNVYNLLFYMFRRPPVFVRIDVFAIMDFKHPRNNPNHGTFRYESFSKGQQTGFQKYDRHLFLNEFEPLSCGRSFANIGSCQYYTFMQGIKLPPHPMPELTGGQGWKSKQNTEHLARYVGGYSEQQIKMLQQKTRSTNTLLQLAHDVAYFLTIDETKTFITELRRRVHEQTVLHQLASLLFQEIKAARTSIPTTTAEYIIMKIVRALTKRTKELLDDQSSNFSDYNAVILRRRTWAIHHPLFFNINQSQAWFDRLEDKLQQALMKKGIKTCSKVYLECNDFYFNKRHATKKMTVSDLKLTLSALRPTRK